MPTGISPVWFRLLSNVMRFRIVDGLSSALLVVWCSASAAQDSLRVGFREDAPPFSSLNTENKLTGNTVPVPYEGFSVDICHRVLEEYLVGTPDAQVDVFGMSASDRQDLLDADTPAFDMLCDSTSMTNDRLDACAFSFPYFVTGITYATDDAGNTAPLADLQSEKLGLVGGTTTVTRISELWQKEFSNKPDASQFEDYATGLAAVISGEVAAIFGDQILLQGAVEQAKQEFAVAKDIYSVELYGICINPERKDLLAATNRTLAKLYASSEIYAILGQHFGGKGASRILTNVYRMFALPEK